MEEREELERFARLGEMAAGLAHDLRGPLHIIASAAEAALESLPAKDPRRAAWELVSRSAASAATRAEGVLEFARTGKMRPEPQPLEPLIEEAAALAREAGDRRAQIVLRLAAPSPVPLDRRHLLGALYNVILNACQAAPRGGTVTVSSGRSGGEAWVLVADPGPGFAKAVLEKLGKPFATGKPAGVGLGLYLARRVLEGHGGRLEVAPRGAKGAKVKLRLPLPK